MGKKFDTKSVANKFFTQDTHSTEDTQNTHDKLSKLGRPPKKPEEKLQLGRVSGYDRQQLPDSKTKNICQRIRMIM